MIKKTLIGSVFSLFLFVQPTFAGWGDQGSTELSIDFIEVQSHAVTVYFEQPVYNPANCRQRNHNTASWENTANGADNFFLTMIMAKVHHRKVRVLLDETSCLWGGWKKLNQIQLR